MMSGRVVGIVQRNLRDYVVALQDNEAMSDRCENVGYIHIWMYSFFP